MNVNKSCSQAVLHVLSTRTGIRCGNTNTDTQHCHSCWSPTRLQAPLPAALPHASDLDFQEDSKKRHSQRGPQLSQGSCAALCAHLQGWKKKIIKTFLKVLWQNLNQDLKLGPTARYLSQGVLRFHVKAKVNEEGIPGDPALDAREPLAPSPAVQAVPDPLAAVRQGAAGIAGTLPSCRLQQRNESSRTNWNLNSKIWP